MAAEAAKPEPALIYNFSVICVFNLFLLIFNIIIFSCASELAFGNVCCFGVRLIYLHNYRMDHHGPLTFRLAPT